MPDLGELLHAPARRRGWRALLLLTMAGVSWFAFVPDPGGPRFAHADKLNHFLAFGTLAVLAALCTASGLRPAAVALVGLLAYGGFIELVQTQLPTRRGDWTDWLADGVGIVLGLLTAATLRRHFPPRSRPG
jgi:VanZ family protein